MKVAFEVRTPGWVPSRVPRWSRPLVLVLTLAIGVPVVLASDGFVDVPNSSVHHDDVNKLASAGVTVGCGPDIDGNPLFCPGQAVSREQMATFLSRGLPRIATGSWGPPDQGSTSSTDPEALATAQIVAGIPATAVLATGFLKIDAFATFNSTDPNPCQAFIGGALLKVEGNVQTTVTPVPTVGLPKANILAGQSQTVPLTFVAEVGPGTYKVELLAVANDSVEGDGCATSLYGHINMTYIPFDENGNNDD